MQPCSVEGCFGYSRFDVCDVHFNEQTIWARGYDAGNAMMAKAVATAKLLERKRIIKLVEEWRKALITGESYTDEEVIKHRDSGYADGFDYLIALINGEK